jgi:MinD superfamily P-loop ATPase
VKQLTVVSGKGGTGKTVVTAGFAALAKEKVMVDCDVDAADLHLLLHPTLRERHPFSGGSVAVRDATRCTGCGRCSEVCRFGAVSPEWEIDAVACEGCGYCVRACPAAAIRLEPQQNGEWYVSDTRHGTLVHARLGAGEENSGKLVSQVRKEAQSLAARAGARLIIADGPPGIGCPLIASITGADLVLAVTEPSLSGIHDVQRVAAVAARFGIRFLCTINKHDINPGNSAELESWCGANGIPIAGRIPFDEAVVRAIVAGAPVVEAGPSRAGDEVRRIWQEVTRWLELDR